MVRLFQLIGNFLNNMDAKAWISLLVSLALLAFVLLMLVFGRDILQLDQGKVQEIMVEIAESPFALIGVISVFCLMAMTGFPQTLLFAGAVAVFGPRDGAINAWIATMCSATLTFGMGNMFGAGFVGRLSAGRAKGMIDSIQRHGVLSTMMIRWIPSGPFIVVNAIAGAARISILKFWLGTGIGIIPKIFVVAALGGQVDQILKFFTNRDPQHLVVLAAIIVGWLAFLVFVRWLFTRMRLRDSSEEA